MRKWLVVLILLGLLPGCGIYMSIQEQKRQEAAQANQQAMNREMDMATQEWRKEADAGRFPTKAALARALFDRMEAIQVRYGVPVDPLDRALASYTVAVMARVDRNELTVEEARYLSDKMEADIARERERMQLERQRLLLQGAIAASEAQAREQALWMNVWSNFQRANQRNPVNCTVIHSGSVSSVNCY